MVMLQVNLDVKANKSLEMFKVYSGCHTKQEALNKLLREYDLSDIRKEFEGGD